MKAKVHKLRYCENATKIQKDIPCRFDITGITRFTLLMWGHIKKPRKQKPRKLRLLSSTKGEENRIELLTALNRKSRKSKPRKLRNAYTE